MSIHGMHGRNGDDGLAAEPETLAGLHERLERAAADAGLLELAYRTVATPVGELLLVASDQGVLRVAYDCQDHDRVLESLAMKVGPRILRAPARLDRVAHQLDEYFTSRRRVFDLPLDLRLAQRFRREVLSHLSAIRYGETRTYAEVAVAAAQPGAVRAVGSACANNPLPVIVPCHRVIRSDGSLGGYVGGLGAKKVLLSLESAG